VPKIRVKRKGYTRKDGTRVKATTFLVKDRGAPGRRARGAKAGPFKDEKPWIGREGGLGGPGYTHKSERARREILRRKVARDGYRTVLGRVMVLERNTGISSEARRRLEADREFLKRNFGGEGSFGKRHGR